MISHGYITFFTIVVFSCVKTTSLGLLGDDATSQLHLIERLTVLGLGDVSSLSHTLELLDSLTLSQVAGSLVGLLALAAAGHSDSWGLRGTVLCRSKNIKS